MCQVLGLIPFLILAVYSVDAVLRRGNIFIVTGPCQR